MFSSGCRQDSANLCATVLPFVYDRKLAREDSLVVVVSPLVSLMVDQTESLRKRGVRAAILSSAASKVDRTLLATAEDLIASKFLFCAPEAIVCSSWRKELQRPEVSARIVAVAIDEAHCVSKW